MPRPQSQPVLRKAPRKEHPYAPAAATEENKKADEKVFSTRLDRALIRRVKARALEDDISVQVLVAAALTEYLDRNQD